MTHILALDAAWTSRQPTGVTLLRREAERVACLAVAPSCQAFGKLADGRPVRWDEKHKGAAIDVNWLLEQARRFDGVNEIDVVAVDMPLVPCHSLIFGYSRFNLARAACGVNCQSMPVWAALRCSDQALA